MVRRYAGISFALLLLCIGLLLIAGCLARTRSCNGTEYDEDKNDCCNGRIYEGNGWAKCDDTGACYNFNNQSCCNGTIFEGEWGCCDTTVYNSSIQRCCGTTLYDKWTNLSCCGDEIYDYKTQDCCNDTIYNGQGWYECEGAGICYNNEDQVCCNGNINDRAQYGECCDGYLCPQGELCCNDNMKGPTCYDPDEYQCLRTY